MKVERISWRKPAPPASAATPGRGSRRARSGDRCGSREPSPPTDALVRLGVGFNGTDDGLAGDPPLAASIRPRDAEYVRLALADFSAKTVQLNLGVLHDVR